MKKQLALLLLVLSALQGLAQTRNIQEFYERKNRKEVLVAAHRGDWKNHPENSLSGIQSCIEKQIDIIELDVQKTLDGKYILMHDNTITRTTTGNGKVSALTLAKIKTYYLRDKDGKPTAERVPSLEEALILAKGKIMINLDKSSERFDDLLVIIDSLGVRDQIILKGFHKSEYFFNYLISNPEGPLFMPIFQYTPYAKLDTFLLDAHPAMVEVILPNDTSYLVHSPGLTLFQKYGTGLWYNAMFKGIAAGKAEGEDARASWQWFVNHGALVIQTDYPFDLMQYLIETKKHIRPSNWTNIPIKVPLKIPSN